MPTRTPQDYQSMFSARRDAIWTLLQLARQQLAWIQEDHFDKLLSVVEQKQPAVEQFDQSTVMIRESWDHWKEDRQQFPLPDRERTEQLLEETEVMLKELIELDRQGIDELKSKRDQTQAELQQLSAGAAVHESVQSTVAPSTHRQLDIQG